MIPYGILAEYTQSSINIPRPCSYAEVLDILGANFLHFNSLLKRCYLHNVAVLPLLNGELLENYNSPLTGKLELIPVYSAAGFFSKLVKIITAPFKVVGKILGKAWNWLTGKKNESSAGANQTYKDENENDEDSFGRTLTNSYAKNKNIPVVYGEMLCGSLELSRTLVSMQVPRPTAEEIKELAKENKTNQENVNTNEQAGNASQLGQDKVQEVKVEIERMLTTLGVSLTPESNPVRYYTDKDWAEYYKTIAPQIKKEYESKKKYVFSGWYHDHDGLSESHPMYSTDLDEYDRAHRGLPTKRTRNKYTEVRRENSNDHWVTERDANRPIYIVSDDTKLSVYIEREKRKYFESHPTIESRGNFEDSEVYRKLNEQLQLSERNFDPVRIDIITRYIQAYKTAWEEGRGF